jgi:hypothetical protein
LRRSIARQRRHLGPPVPERRWIVPDMIPDRTVTIVR